MKNTARIVCAALLSLFAAGASGAEKIPPITSYVVVLSDKALELPEGAGASCQISKNGSAVRYYHSAKNPREWSEGSFKFRAARSCNARIILSAVDAKKKDGSPANCAAYYDDIRVNGKLLPNGDFSGGLEGWKTEMLAENAFPPRLELKPGVNGGNPCARVSYAGRVCKIFPVKGGCEYEVSFRTKYAGRLKQGCDDVPLDIAQYYNYGGGAGALANVSLPDPKLTARGKKIEGIRFAADTSGGGRALVIRNKLAPTAPMSVEFTLTPDQKAMKSLYILHTLSDAIKPECAAMCRVIFIDKKGAQTKRDIHIGRDIFTPDQTPRGMNAICVKAEGGNLCFSRFDLPQGTEKIAFAGFYKSPWIIYAATLSDSDVPAFETFRPTPGKWTSAGVDGGFYEIKSGSALDLSGILQTPVPAGSTGRAIVSPRGTIAFESAPDVDVRFKSYSLWDSKLFIYLPPEERKARIREYAAYVRLQGYNLVRIKLDYLKCHDELPRREEYFDMADFMLSEFRKNGVYYQLIFGTYDDGRPGYKFGLHNEIKMLAIIGDKETWDRWKEGALSFLNHVNPYTGAAWKDDPALLSVEYYNELTNSLGRLYQLEKSVRDRALAKFVEYLKGKYANIGELNAAWNCFKLSDKKYAFKSFDEIPGEKLDRRNNDWLLFGWENIYKFGEFAEGVVRGAGYKGIVSECNTAGSFAGRHYANRFTDVVIVNSYFSHPSGFMSRGVSCGQNSAIGSDWATNGIASVKLANRPASITEYNYCYWNKYRYEACVLISPYCALQNFSVMTIHQDVVTQLKFRKGVGDRPGLGSFSVGPSPVMRASELLMSCFFIRGDVKPSPHRVYLSVPDEFLKKPEAARSPHPEQARISALMGFAMKFSKMDNTPFAKTVRIKPADVEISPQGSANIRMEAWFQEVEKGEGSFDLEKFVSVLREKKILPEGNKTDVKNGIYQSDTGQITRDMKNLTMKVVTEKSAAVAMEKSHKEELGALTVESPSVPATVGVCSLDGEKISDSKRLVFVYATREANSDMVTSFDNTYAIFIGSKDVMLENGVVKAKLKLRADRDYEVYPLSLDGTRREKLVLKVKDGVMEIEIDNSKLPGGLSTTMFEIAAK